MPKHQMVVSAILWSLIKYNQTCFDLKVYVFEDIFKA